MKKEKHAGRTRPLYRLLNRFSYRSSLIAVASIMLFASMGAYYMFSTKAATGITAGSQDLYDIAYANTHSRQKLDLFLPQRNGTAVPLVINIHGGGFGYFDDTKSDAEANVDELRSAGYAVASIEYRWYQDAKFPAGAQDVKAAVRWLRAHAATYGIDPGKFTSWGWSAGGYYAVMLGVTGNISTVFDQGGLGNEGVSSAVQAVVDLYGPVDFKTMDSQCDGGHNNADSPESQWLGGPIQSNSNLAASNLISYIPSNKPLPRFLVRHGTEDCSVPPGQSQELADAVNAAGGTIDLQFEQGVGHSDAGMDQRAIAPSISMMNNLFASGTTTPNPPPTNPPPTSTGDTTAPTVAISAPAAGASVSGSVKVSGSASDNTAVTKVELLVDGAVKMTNTSASATFYWTSTAVGDGSHALALKAYDAAGNSRTSASVSVTVSNTAAPKTPQIKTFTASPGSVSTGGKTTLTWSTLNVANCSINPGGPQGATATYWQTPVLTSAGTKTYTLDCQNSAGHATKTVSVTVTAAATPPSKPVLSVSGTAIQSGSSVTVAWTSGGATSCVLNPGNITSGSSASKTFTNVTSTKTYTLSCSNAAGTVYADPVTVTVVAAGVSVTVANPVITNFTATPATISNGQMSMLAWQSSNVAAGGCKLTPSPLNTTNASGSWRTPALSASATYTLTCVNSAGRAVSKSVSVVVDGAPAPAAPAASTPTVTGSSASQAIIVASNGQKISNAAASNQVSGLAVLDPSNVTDTSKEQSIVKVEYYDGETLIQTDTQAPFAMDTAKLKNGQYTITERTYFNDGSQSEVAKVIDIANDLVASTHAKQGSILPGLLVGLTLVAAMGFGVFIFVRKKLNGNMGASAYAAVVDNTVPSAPPANYGANGVPDWQQQIAPQTPQQRYDQPTNSDWPPRNFGQ